MKTRTKLILLGVIGCAVLLWVGCQDKQDETGIDCPFGVKMYQIVSEGLISNGRVISGGINYVYFGYKLSYNSPSEDSYLYLKTADNTTYLAATTSHAMTAETCTEEYFTWDGMIYNPFYRRYPVPLGNHQLQTQTYYQQFSQWKSITVQANSWDTDGDNISNAVEDKNEDTEIIVDGNVYTGDTYLLNNVNWPPLIPLNVSQTDTVYPNRGMHDHTIARYLPYYNSQTDKYGRLYNGIMIADGGAGYNREPNNNTNCDFIHLGMNPDNWGTLELINLIEKVGRAWNKLYQNHEFFSDDYPNFTVKDLSRKGGGKFQSFQGCPGHDSHQNGLDVDIRLVRVDQNTARVVYNETGYSLQRTQELINLFIQLGNIDVIFFNDPNALYVQSADGHDDHLHIRINNPDGNN